MDYFFRDGLSDDKIDLGVFLPDIFIKWWQEIGCQGRNNSNAQFARKHVFLVTNKLLDHLGLTEDYSCLSEYARTNLGGNYRLLRAIKNFHPEFFLQLLNLHAQCRLGDKTFFRSEHKMAMGIQCHNIFKRSE